MTLEVGRRWVNGRWTTDVENESGGGGGGGGTLPVVGSGSGNVGDLVGVVYSDPSVVVVGGTDKDTPLTGNGAVMTDAYAQWNGNGAGLYWNGNGTDGEQELLVKNAAGTTILHDADGNMTVVGAVASSQLQGQYESGGVEVIENGDSGDLAFALDTGAALLNLADPDAPTFVAGGTYGITVTADVTAPFTAGGYAAVSVEAAGQAPIPGTIERDTVTLAGIVQVAVAAPLVVRVTNNDGAAQRQFTLVSANIVKLA